MTREDQKRLRVMERLQAGIMTNLEAAAHVGVSARQIIRIKKKYAAEGAQGLIHGNRGRKPKHAMDESTKEAVVALFNERYSICNFTHFRDLLEEEEGVNVSCSSVERILKAEGVSSKKKKRRAPKKHRLRERMAAIGIMWQTDAAAFAWLGKGTEPFTLHAYIDDAAGIVTGAAFTRNECTRGYCEALRAGMLKWGVPVKVYTDRHTIFKSPKELTIDEELNGETVPLSNFGKALKELDIVHLTAQSPQAKGRIERLWGTFQDRLATELQLAGIKTMDEANKLLPHLIQRHNDRFSVRPKEELNMHRPLDKTIDLNLVFSTRETRKSGGGCSMSYHNVHYVPVEANRFAPRDKTTVEVREDLNGAVWVVYGGHQIAMRPVTANEKLQSSAAVKKAASQPKQLKQAADNPWRHFKITPSKYAYKQTCKENEVKDTPLREELLSERDLQEKVTFSQTS